MGAYYMACIEGQIFDTHALDNGLKLMEHSYLYNNYCQAIEYKLLDNPKSLVWLCDYHEANEDTKLTWDNTEEVKTIAAPSTYTEHSPIVYIVNHSKGIYFEKSKLKKLCDEAGIEWRIHPLPILCNSDRESMGGGDYHPDDSRRGTWCSDDISVHTSSNELIENFTDVTEDCIFQE
jgi:hypothetical protein